MEVLKIIFFYLVAGKSNRGILAGVAHRLHPIQVSDICVLLAMDPDRNTYEKKNTRIP